MRRDELRVECFMFEHVVACEWSVAWYPVERFIKDNDAKRQRALKKERDEAAERLKLQQEVEALELSERRTRMSLLELMDTLRRLAKYEEFLEGEDALIFSFFSFFYHSYSHNTYLDISGASFTRPVSILSHHHRLDRVDKTMSSCEMNLSRGIIKVKRSAQTKEFRRTIPEGVVEESEFAEIPEILFKFGTMRGTNVDLRRLIQAGVVSVEDEKESLSSYFKSKQDEVMVGGSETSQLKVGCGAS